MKVRVLIPEPVWRGAFPTERVQDFIDEVLMWGMETGLDVAHYATIADREFPDVPYRWQQGRVLRKWAVFTIEADNAFMFTLKWGALMHKNKVAA